jgi:hypothetical protein
MSLIRIALSILLVLLCTPIPAQNVYNQAPFTEPLQTVIPTVGFAKDSHAGTEGGPPVRIDIVLSQATNQQVSVFYTTTGAASPGRDYALTNGLITFAPGQTTQTLIIPIVDDRLTEGEETLILSLTNPQNAMLGQSMTTLTIQDNDKLPAPTPGGS